MTFFKNFFSGIIAVAIFLYQFAEDLDRHFQ